MIYALDVDKWKPKLLPRTESTDSRYKDTGDAKGPWTSSDLTARNYYSLGTYSVISPSGRTIQGPPPGRYWAISKTSFEELNNEGRIYWGESGNNMPRLKRYLSDVKEGVVPQTMWFYKDVGHTQEAKKELLDLVKFNKSDDVFITPKPTRLIQRILQIATDNDSLILDSFAGSGTTGHAVLKQNAEDGGNRRFILVEMESHIARNVTAERVRRVAEGYTNAKGEPVAGLGSGFRYCELGEPLFDEYRQIRDTVSFADLARHVYFSETGEPLPRESVANTPLIGVYHGIGIYLLYNGILRDQSEDGGNVLTRAIMAQLPHFDGPKIIYCAGCLIEKDRLQAERILHIRQTPYEIKQS